MIGKIIVIAIFLMLFTWVELDRPIRRKRTAATSPRPVFDEDGGENGGDLDSESSVAGTPGWVRCVERLVDVRRWRLDYGDKDQHPVEFVVLNMDRRGHFAYKLMSDDSPSNIVSDSYRHGDDYVMLPFGRHEVKVRWRGDRLSTLDCYTDGDGAKCLRLTPLGKK
jgi:hypothetical protein